MERGRIIVNNTDYTGSFVTPNPSEPPTKDLNTLEIEGEVFNIAGGGGGGNVADVYVNGTSVLDANDIAQVFSHEEITEISYDNLPSTKFSDNHMYLIKEAGTPPTGEYYNPVIYSEEEREIGVWINNKPLYQKTLVFENYSSGDYKDVSALNIEEVVASWGEHKQANGDYSLSFPYYENSNWYSLMTFDKTNERYYVYCSSNMANSYPYLYVTIQYTKTTDVAGSGSYNTLGVPNVHYSTDEQIIGTWIDGKPLYQKTYIINETIYNQDKTIDISDLNIKKYVNGYGTFLRNVNWATPILFIDTPFNLYESNINRSYLRYGKTNNTIDYGIYLGNNETATDITITIQYTKTTD